MSKICDELVEVGVSLRKNGFPISATVVERSAARMKEMEKLLVSANDSDDEDLKILVAQAYDIVDIELLPNAAHMAIQDFGRLNEFMMSATPIKKEIDG